MPKLTSYKRINTGDFDEEYQKLIEKLAAPINYSFNELYFALNGRLDLRSNFASGFKEFDVIVDATGRPVNTTIVGLSAGGPILGLSVIGAVNQSNTSVYPTGQPFISYTQVENGVLINNITGLQPNNRYTIRVIAWS